MGFIKSVRNREAACARCNGVLGIRNHYADTSWGFSGKLCNACSQAVNAGIHTYDATTYAGGHSKVPVQVKGWLLIYVFDKRNTILFRPDKKSNQGLLIECNKITSCRIVSRTESSIKKMLLTAGISKTQESRYLQINYYTNDDSQVETVFFDVGDKLDQVHHTIMLIIPGAKNAEPVARNHNVKIAPKLFDRPCSSCVKNPQEFIVESGGLCKDCFSRMYGAPILKSDAAFYYGGHKAYLAGGLFTKQESGKLYLTNKSLIYTKNKGNPPENRWSIIIPLTSINVERYGIEEEHARRRQISGAENSFDGALIGSGFTYHTGKEHHLIVAYRDENNIPQTPRFGIPSFGGKAIRVWASALYDQVALTQAAKNKAVTTSKAGLKPVPPDNSSESPIQILRKRLAKGEITKQEFEELRAILLGD